MNLEINYTNIEYQHEAPGNPEKEFDQHSKIGFGIDGDEQTKEADFEAIRGTYDGNSFVKSLRKDITEIEVKAANLSRILSME